MPHDLPVSIIYVILILLKSSFSFLTDHQDLAKLNWFSCEPCNKYFPSEQAITKHNRIIHPNSSIGNKLLCDFCSATFQSTFYLYRHANRVHMEEISKIWIECKVCGKFLPHPGAMGSHVQSRHPKYHKQIQTQMTLSRPGIVIDTSCDFCGLHYGLRKSLEDHIRFNHSEEITKKNCQTQCKFCSVMFQSQNLCFSHVNAEHLEQIRSENWINCLNCKLSFPSETVYVIHRFSCYQSKQRQDTSLQCEFCIQTFNTTGEYYRHANDVHIESLSEWQLCSNCNLNVPHLCYKIHQDCCNRNTIEANAVNYSDLGECKCEFCDKSYKQRKHLLWHVNQSHREAVRDGPNECQFCSSHMDSNQKLYSHVTEQHASQLVDNANWVTCPFCKLFIPQDRYIAHKVLKHSGLKAPPDFLLAQVCKFCSESFDNCHLYYLHANKEHNVYLAESNWVQCNRCRHYYPGMPELNHHKDTFCPSVKRKRIEDAGGTEISCPFCPQTFLRNHNYQYHLNKHHRKDLVSAKWISCTSCDSMFKTIGTMQAHARMCIKKKASKKANSYVSYSRKKDLPCSFCDKICSAGNKFYDHNNKHHAKDIVDTWFECTLCNMRYPTKKVLRSHMGHRMCTKSKKIQCDFCSDYSTYKRIVMRKHCLAKHKEEMQEKWLQCPNCKEHVGDAEHLKWHLIKCNGRPAMEPVSAIKVKALIPCSFCSERFPKLIEYVRHANESHSEEVVEAAWSQCEKCCDYIPKMWNMQKHADSCKAKRK